MTVRIEVMGPHFTKVHIEIPGQEPILLHRFSAAEPEGTPHDHPWGFTSEVLHGGYVEQVYAVDGSSQFIERRPGDKFDIAATHIHRLTHLFEGESWTRVWPGPPEQVPGFWHWDDGQPWRRAWNGDWQPVHGEAE